MRKLKNRPNGELCDPITLSASAHSQFKKCAQKIAQNGELRMQSDHPVRKSPFSVHAPETKLSLNKGIQFSEMEARLSKASASKLTKDEL
jgi:hypothetical protein